MAQTKTKDVRVRTDKNQLFLDFYYRDVRCREYLAVKNDTKGRNYAERQAKLIEKELLNETFEYAEWFPLSKKCIRFGSKVKLHLTFEQVASEWKSIAERSLKVGEMKAGTYKKYVSDLKQLLPRFGGIVINNIAVEDVENYRYALLDDLSKKTVNCRMTPLRRIFEYAYTKGYIKEDIMGRVKNFNIDLPDIEPFNQAEVNAILTHLKEKNQKAYNMFVILFHTGMRIGEVLAMKWKYFDEMFQSYNVREQFTDRKLEDPKTKSSKRTVPLTEEAMRALKDQKQHTYLKSEFIFCNQYGEPWLSSEHIMRQVWTPTLKKLGIAYRIIYQCRHTHASLSILAGDNLAHIAERMGHKNVGTLITRYAKYVKAVEFQQPKIGAFLSSEKPICQNAVRNEKTPSLSN